MAKKPKCTSGNKACGGRCIPQDHNCGADAGAGLDKKLSSVSEAKTRKNSKRVRAGFAKKRLKEMKQEAYALAGGKEQYQQELEEIIKDTGAGIPAIFLRNTMRTLAPNLITADDLNMYITTKTRGKYEEQVVRSDPKKFKLEDIIRKGDKLKKGDIVRVRFASDSIAGGFGYHYGVYLGNGRLIQYNRVKREKGKKRADTDYAGVHESHFKDLVKKGQNKWEKVEEKTKYTPEELAQRINKVRNEKVKYNMMTNNCEHFAYLLTQGKAYSSQADVSRGVAAQIVRVVFMYYQNQILRKKAGFMDKKFAKDFKTVSDFQFAERNYQGERPVGSEYNEEFAFPRNQEDIEADLMNALSFSEQASNGDGTTQIGILSGWLKTYITNLNFVN